MGQQTKSIKSEGWHAIALATADRQANQNSFLALTRYGCKTKKLKAILNGDFQKKATFVNLAPSCYT